MRLRIRTAKRIARERRKPDASEVLSPRHSAAFALHALGVVTRARIMGELAHKSGMSCEGLCKAPPTDARGGKQLCIQVHTRTREAEADRAGSACAMTHCFPIVIWWAVEGSNFRPLPCEGSALPLS